MASRQLLRQGWEELAAGDVRQASEKGWGAAAQMVKSIAERRAWQHTNHAALFTAVSRLVNETGRRQNMNWNRKVMTMVVLVATLLTAGVAAMPATLSSPTLPTVMATANPGELLITWDAVPDAQHYTIGYANLDELEQMTEAGRSALDAFYYVTIGAAHTVHTLNGLEPGIDYYVLVGAQTKRFGADDLVWGPWSSAVRTAEASCPTTETTTQQCVSNGTCLPIREIGRVGGTGDSADTVMHLRAGLYRAKMMHTGSSNFIIYLVEVDTGRKELLANEIGNSDEADTFTIYDGDPSYRPQTGNYLLSVEADGYWTAEVDLVAAH